MGYATICSEVCRQESTVTFFFTNRAMVFLSIISRRIVGGYVLVALLGHAPGISIASNFVVQRIFVASISNDTVFVILSWRLL